MTTPAQPDPAADKDIGQFLRPLRDLAVYALLGAPAVFLLVAVIDLLGADFVGRSTDGFSGFVNLETIFFPLAAVLLALGVKPVHPKARLIALTALAEYGVASFFGVIFGVLFGVSHLAASSAAAAFGALLERAAWLALLALAGYVVLQIWLGVFSLPRPKPQPGVYGQPHRQAPFGQSAYGQQPPAPPGPLYGQPPFGGPGPVPPPVATQPYAMPPATYGQYPAAPPSGWGQPPAPAADPTQVVPASAPPSASAQVTPSPPPIDRTSVLPENRPGFGPADQDPPRQ